MHLLVCHVYTHMCMGVHTGKTKIPLSFTISPSYFLASANLELINSAKLAVSEPQRYPISAYIALGLQPQHHHLLFFMWMLEGLDSGAMCSWQALE